jgi:hypothetical protein
LFWLLAHLQVAPKMTNPKIAGGEPSYEETSNNNE